MQHRILIAHSDQSHVHTLIRDLTDSGINFRYQQAHDRNEYVRHLTGFEPDLVVSAPRVGETDARALVHMLKAHLPDTPLIITTEESAGDLAEELLRDGEADYVRIAGPREVPSAVDTALAEREARRRQLRAEWQANGATDYEEISWALDLMRAFLDWPIAHMYSWDETGGELISTQAWSGDLRRLHPTFVDATNRHVFTPGEGLIGRVYERSEPIWIEELENSLEYKRAQPARRAGLASAVAFPIVTEHSVAAVMELYSWDTQRLDPAVINLLGTIGHEMGRLFELRRFERRVHRRRWELETLLENAPDIIVRTDEQTRITLINSRAEAFGVDTQRLIGTSLARLGNELNVSSEVIERWMTMNRLVREQGIRKVYEWSAEVQGRTVYMQSSVVPEFDHDGAVISQLSFNREITDQREAEESLKRSEERLAHAQRLESVGRLAGGIAHDFNNILTAILGYLYLTRSIVAPDSHVGRYIENIGTAADRAVRLTQQLLLFSRRAPSEITAVDINATVTGTTKMLSRLIREDIHLSTSLTAEPTTVQADRAKLEQVIVNLVVNARDAMPDGGILRLETKRQPAEDSALEARDSVVLTVRDTGVGMSEEIREHIFEPFFTTKGQEHGTGLGLSVAFGIIEEIGGRIEVESTPGSGTAFHVLIPTVLSTPSKDAADRAAPSVGDIPNVHLLLVEDDEAIAEMVERALEARGARITTAPTLAEAKAYLTDDSSIDIVLADVVLPDGSGLSLPEHTGSRTPVILTSGYLEGSGQLEAVEASGHPIIQKPYDISTLMDTIKVSIGRTQP